MMNGRRLPLATLLVLLLAAASLPRGTKADYARARALGKRYGGKVVRRFERAHWLEDGSGLWFEDRRDKRHVFVDAKTGKKGPLYDSGRMAKALGLKKGELAKADLAVAGKAFHVLPVKALEIKVVDRKSYHVRSLKTTEDSPLLLRPVRRRRSVSRGGDTFILFVNPTDVAVRLVWIDFSGGRKVYASVPPGGRSRQHTYVGHIWSAESADGREFPCFEGRATPGIARLDATPHRRKEAVPPNRSPDGRYEVRFENHGVMLHDLKTRRTRLLTPDRTSANPFGGHVWWSPDSRRFVVIRTKPARERWVDVIESSPRDQVQPRRHTFRYRKPGDPIALPRPWLFDARKGTAREVDTTHQPNPWTVSRVRWDLDGKRFTFLHNQRGHQALRVIAVEAETAKASVVLEERSETFIDYAGKLFLHHLAGTGQAIWMSERDGWNHLHLHDLRTGKAIRQLTQGEWVVRRVERVDEEAGRVWFWAGGVRPGESPYHLHLCRVNLDGSGFAILTEGDGTHEVTFSPDGRHFLDRWSRVDLAPVTALRRAEDGKLVCEIDRADDGPLLEAGWRPPERFVAKGRDGKTDIHGVIYRPSNFDPKRKYPVVEAIYAGPHGSHVPRTFRPVREPQQLAELGFITVQIDGMGTSHRSKAFHDVCWKNLGDAGFPDRILWLKAAAKKHPEMDLERVGIYGGSAGGQNALRALLAHGDFYDVAVADCGCHDNRMDKIWWNELWMGWPVGPHYEEQSNVTQAHRLRGKLLLIVGELDRNVDPASTMQVVDALIRADKDFDLLVMPGVGHGAGGTPYGRRRTWDFLVRHLHGVEPRRE